ncbi:hypothetical protein [Micromonospora echinaurantiaca]|uniref:hypothetical protein n=1 Tax=Micromonospora echinaurantiaca TaxID=47857 RepID=UPI00343641D4
MFRRGPQKRGGRAQPSKRSYHSSGLALLGAGALAAVLVTVSVGLLFLLSSTAVAEPRTT